MAVRFYIPKNGGTKLELFIDPGLFTQASDLDRKSDIEIIQGLPDDLRIVFALSTGFTNLVDYDDTLSDEMDEVLDRLDYYTYDNRVENLTVRDGAWFVPEALAPVSPAADGFTGANPPENSIDGNNSSVWRNNVNQRHFIAYQLRSYPKRFRKFRFRFQTLGPLREQLTNITVKASNGIGNLDDPGNVVVTGLNPDWPSPAGGWVEVDLGVVIAKKKFIKLEFDTADPNNDGQIREFQVRVETRAP